jgi:hypothetical protein
MATARQRPNNRKFQNIVIWQYILTMTSEVISMYAKKIDFSHFKIPTGRADILERRLVMIQNKKKEVFN